MCNSVVKTIENQLDFQQILSNNLRCDRFSSSPSATQLGDDAAAERCPLGSVCSQTTSFILDDKSAYCGYFRDWNIRIRDVRFDFARTARPTHVLVAGNFFKVDLKFLIYLVTKFWYFPTAAWKFGRDSSTELAVAERSLSLLFWRNSRFFTFFNVDIWGDPIIGKDREASAHSEIIGK